VHRAHGHAARRSAGATWGPRHSWRFRWRIPHKLNPDPLDLIERDFVTGPVIELSRSRRLMICDRLRGLQRAAVEQVRSDSGRAPRVAADIDAEARGQGAPADHPVDISLRQLVARRLSVPDRLKQRRFLFVPQARGVEIGVDIFLGRVMRRDLMQLAAFLVQAEAPLLSALEVVFDAHGCDGAHASEAVDHHANEGPIPQSDQFIRGDRVQELPRLVRSENRSRVLGIKGTENTLKGFGRRARFAQSPPKF